MRRSARVWAVALAALFVISAGYAHASPAGTWQGFYDCAQGKTALALTITSTGGGNVRALFYFHALPGNPRVPSGCFTMAGHYHRASRRVVLRPALWLRRPAHFVWVSIFGRIGADGQEMTGRIEGPGCFGFTLSHSEKPVTPPPPAACRMVPGAPTV